MARRSEHTQEQIREMVLSAAENIVIDEGFNALTVRKVAMEIGYTVGSIYMVFENMDDLIMHVKGRTLDSLAEALRVEQVFESAEAHIQALAEIYLNFARQHYNRWRMIFEAINDVATPAWYQQKCGYFPDYRKRAAGITPATDSGADQSGGKGLVERRARRVCLALNVGLSSRRRRRSGHHCLAGMRFHSGWS